MPILLLTLQTVLVLVTSKEFETTIRTGTYKFGINVNIGDTKTTVTLSGSYAGVQTNPNMALGFGNTEMDGTYAILIQAGSNNVSITETILSGSSHRGETTVTTGGDNWVQESITDDGTGNLFMSLTRDNQVSCSGCYTFDSSVFTLDMIWCVLLVNDNTAAIEGHSEKGIIQSLAAVVPVCRHNLVVEITNLNGISSFDFQANGKLRAFITNVTYNGIAQTSLIQQQFSIGYLEEFDVIYNETSDNLNITQSVCAKYDDPYIDNGSGWRSIIFGAVLTDKDQISAYIKYKIMRYFEGENDASMDNMMVDIYFQLPFVEYDVAPERIEPEIMNIPSLYITIIILVLFSLFTLISLMDAKLCRKNDYFCPLEIMTASLEVTDTILDLLFAIALLLLYIADNKLIQVLIASIASFMFIIIPITFSIFQLLQKQKNEWFNDDHLSIWLIDNGKILFALSIITGSSYSAIQIVNCGAFKLEIFNMGLSKLEKIKFNTKRVGGVVFLENIPQMAIQIWYLVRFGVDFLPILSIIFSMTSIALTVLTLYTQKTIVKQQQMITIEFDIIGDEIKPKLSTKTKAIKLEIGVLLGLKASLIEIKRPKIIAQGLRFEINLFVNTENHKAGEYELKMNGLVNNDKLMNIMKREWDLIQPFKIENVNVSDRASVEIVQNRKYASIDKLDED